LYTDQDETILMAQRPLIINGIKEVATRGDILDRAIHILCPFIDERKRKDEKRLWAQFNKESPYILGALFTAVSLALGDVAAVDLEEAPRMADFARWAAAAAPGLGFTPDEFLEAYKENRQGVHKVALDDSLVAMPVCALVEKAKRWEGTATALLDRLKQDNPDTARKKGWPQTASSLSNELRQIAPNLRGIGVLVEFEIEKDKKRTRKIVLRQFEHAEDQPQEQPQKHSQEHQKEQLGDSPSAASKAQQNQGSGRTASDGPRRPADGPATVGNGEASAVDYRDAFDLEGNRTASDDHRGGGASEANTNDSAGLGAGRTMPDTADGEFPLHSNSHASESDEANSADAGGFDWETGGQK
jgi:hypothetical protein